MEEQMNAMKNARETVLWKLQKNNLSQTWLVNRLEERGLPASKFNLSDILRGVRRSSPADEFIRYSLDILDSYEQWHDGFVHSMQRRNDQ